MASNVYIESLVSSAKRLRISSPKLCTQRALHQRSAARSSAASGSTTRHHAAIITAGSTRSASQLTTTTKQQSGSEMQDLRLPKAVQAVFLAPLKRAPTHGIPVCDLQIRSYSVRNLEAFADFCLRAAYYLKLPAKGPVPLPRITERWTVPRSNFVHKKSQENFERITVRRLIQIQDGHPETVALFLAYIQKHRYYGVGMKANVFEHGKLEVVEDMEREAQRLNKTLGEEYNLFGSTGQGMVQPEAFQNALIEEPFKAQWGAYGGMAGIYREPTGRRRFRRHTLQSESVSPTARSTEAPAAEA